MALTVLYLPSSGRDCLISGLDCVICALARQVELFGGRDAAGSAVPPGVFALVPKHVLDREAEMKGGRG